MRARGSSTDESSMTERATGRCCCWNQLATNGPRHCCSTGCSNQSTRSSCSWRSPLLVKQLVTRICHLRGHWRQWPTCHRPIRCGARSLSSDAHVGWWPVKEGTARVVRLNRAHTRCVPAPYHYRTPFFWIPTTSGFWRNPCATVMGVSVPSRIWSCPSCLTMSAVGIVNRAYRPGRKIRSVATL